ncbi:MAG: DNA topoisomerase IB [Caulobacter sp.]|nr:DNA topoisomerase IB [Caulobacter sp.]
MQTTDDRDLPANLTWCNDDGPGIRRDGAHPEWSYHHDNGKVVKEAATLARIRGLAIPPAWRDVWIAPKASCHIQATGRDARGRKQYRYHARWKTARAEGKFDRMLAFARALPALRKRLDSDLRRRGLPREKVLAAVVRMLELTLIRIGNDEYARSNKSFGLTTLRKRHLTLNGAGAMFTFRGKSGKDHCTGFHDRRLARVVGKCAELRGQRLFQYVDEDGVAQAVTSGDVNDYLHEVLGADFTAKDFRTWFGTLAAARSLSQQPTPDGDIAARRALNACIGEVAGLLGNTVAVCRSAYVHPRLIDLFSAGRLTLRPCLEGRRLEIALIRLLEADRPGKASSPRVDSRLARRT